MWETISNIIGKAQSELFLFLILLSIVVIVLLKPLAKQFIDAIATRRTQENVREANIIEVIKGNSSVMAELKTLLKETNDNCSTCKTEQLARFQRIEDKSDSNAIVLNKINEIVHLFAGHTGGVIDGATGSENHTP
jgi:hypothetical protein